MNRIFTRISMVAAAAAIAALTSRVAQAQLPIPSLSIVGGVSQYNLSSGDGTTPVGAIRVDIPLLVLVAEGSVGAFRPTDVAGGHQTYIIPEAQLQYQLFPLLVRPYVGVGGGVIVPVGGSGTTGNESTLSAAAGVRFGVPLTGIGFRAEVRARTVGGWSNHAVEWTLGLNF